MSAISVEWHDRTANLEKLVKEFNENVKKSTPVRSGPDHLFKIVDDILPLVQGESKRLQELTNEIALREKELSIKTWCSIPVSISRNVRNLIVLNTTVKICEIVGVTLALTAESNTYAKWAGLGLAGSSAVVDVIASAHESHLYLESGEVSLLGKINKNGFEHAKVFEAFLKKLKQTKQNEDEKIEAYHSRSSTPLLHQSFSHIETKEDVGPKEDLDKKISACLNEYEELPKTYRDKDVHSRIIFQLIQRLPESDPLRIGLNSLEPLDVKHTGKRDLHTSYLSVEKRRSSSTGEETGEGDWRGEENSHLQDSQSDILGSHIRDSKEDTAKYKEMVKQYQYSVMHRFGLNRTIPYIETPNGWKVSPDEEIQKVQEYIEEAPLDPVQHQKIGALHQDSQIVKDPAQMV